MAARVRRLTPPAPGAPVHAFAGRWLSVSQAARWAGVTEGEVEQWVREHRVQWQCTPGGDVRVWEPSIWRT